MSQSLDELRAMEIPEITRFEEGSGGLLQLIVNTPLASACIVLQGAHVTHFQAAGEDPLLFVSSASAYRPGKAIRGGVPLIFPWFGANAEDPTLQSHGFARTVVWTLKELHYGSGGRLAATFLLSSSETTYAQWPHHFSLCYRVVIGTELEMSLEVTNPSDASFQYEAALHTYLSVADAAVSSIDGLANTEYLDKTDGFKRKRQETSPFQLTKETDRTYVNTETLCTVSDPAAKRVLRVTKSNSRTTVVWNPWLERAAALADMGPGEWKRMICIETANAGENNVHLHPGQMHKMSAIVSSMGLD